MIRARPVALVVALAVALFRPAGAHGAEEPAGVVRALPTRADVTVPVFWVRQNAAPATLVLLPGSAGGIGRVVPGGWPESQNVMIRSARLFAAHGFNLVIVSRPSDIADLDYAARVSDDHMSDLRAVAAFAREAGAAPVWLVATSRGTISAAAAAIAMAGRGLVDGVVLASSIVTHHREGALPYQRLERIDVPVLMVHHRRDGCRLCDPREVPTQFERLSGAPIRKLVIVDGGSDLRGDPCEAFHWHGFVGMEAAFVDLVAAWIKRPLP